MPDRSWYFDLAQCHSGADHDLGSGGTIPQPGLHADRRVDNGPHYCSLHRMVLLGVSRQSRPRRVSLMPRAKQLGWFFGIWLMSVAALAGVGAIIRLVL